MVVRKPAAAGRFYPSSPERLSELVKGFLSDARKEMPVLSPDTKIVEILSPHAGFIFSGATAAHAYVELEGRDYDTVILIGPPHHVRVHGASVYCGDAFETPLGSVPVNTDLARRIASSSHLINDDERPHIQEHSLEVQLPFLQMVMKDFSIVPILIMGNKDVLDSVAHAMSDVFREIREQHGSVLFIISTDLAHFPEKKDADKCDVEILQAFCTLDADLLLKKDKEIMSRGVPNLACTMCGLDAAYVGIRIANAMGGTEAFILDRSVSSDAHVPGAGTESVVGYGAVLITGGN